MDDFLSLHLAVAFIVTILLECVLLYILLWEREFYEDDVYITAMVCFWLTVGVINLAIDLILPAMVNSTVNISIMEAAKEIDP